jgi:hypothetical protein
MSAEADTNCHDIFNIVSATRTHLAKIGVKCHVVPTCRDMSATFPDKTGMGTGRCPILELNHARTGIGTVFHVWDDGAGSTSARRGRSTSAPTNNNQKVSEWRRSFGVRRWQWHGRAAAEEGGAVRTRRFVDVATSRGQWRRINRSKARTISIDTDKQQSAS